MNRSPLIGRELERERLVDAVKVARSGRGALVLVSGEAGVGKTRLIADVLSNFDGRRVVTTAVAGTGAYAPLEGVLRGHRTGAGPDDQQEEPSDDAARTLTEGFRRLAERGATVVVLEDLHLADAATIEVVPIIAETLETLPVVVLTTYRSDELPRDHAIRRMRADLRRSGRLVDIALRPLATEDTARLLAALLGTTPSPRLVAAVQERAEGLPFFVEELAAALVEGDGLADDAGKLDLATDAALPLPESVVDAVLVRTRVLREQHETSVEYAATLGVHVDLAALASLVDPGEVDVLLDAGLLVEFDDETAVFRHALVRDALYRTIPWTRRRSHHQRVAELLASRQAAPGVLAEHWIAAHAPEKARPLLLAAAAQHCDAHAYRDAAIVARRALSLWPEGDDPAGRVAALEKLADCAELSGETAAAAATWADVAVRQRAAGALAAAGAAHRRAANAAELLGDVSSGVTQRAAAAEAFTAAGALGDAAAERLTLAQRLRSAGRLTEALDIAVAATEDAAAAGRRDIEAHALALQGAARSGLGDGRRGVELAKAGLELALEEQLSEVTPHTYYVLAEALEYAADYAGAVDAYESAFELCRAHGQTEFGQICFVCMSPAARLMGDWDRTLAICGEVLADQSANLVARRVAEEESGLITVLRGDRRRSRGPLRRAAEFGQANGIFGLEIGATWGLALVADLDEDEAAATFAVSTLLERCHTSEECHYALPALRWASTYLADRGDARGVSTCHRVVAALATRNGSPKVLSALAHVGGELAVVDGDQAHARVQFARSVELLTAITTPYDLAHTQLRWGQVSAAAGDREAAIATVGSAYRTARQLRAKPLAQRCATVLTEMGEPVDRRLGRLAARGFDPGRLTRREQEVLRHIGAGKTNREIAAALFLSTRTVDMHVRNLFTKLDCTSRTAAVRRANDRGLLPADG